MDLKSPAMGMVVEVNTAAVKDPTLITKDPMGNGWLIRLAIKDDSVARLLMMSEDEYERFLRTNRAADDQE